MPSLALLSHIGHLLWHRRRAWTFLALAGLALLVLIDRHIHVATAGRVHTDPDDLQPTPVALVLGTAKALPDGRRNTFYDLRIAAAAELYHAGLVRGILVSGDNHHVDYDEPSSMRDDLVAAGVPVDHITCDYAGFRTLDSVVRARAVFGVERAIVVSQAFHCQRALYLGDAHGISLQAYAARDVAGVAGWRVRLRETLARAKAGVDLLCGVEPRFYGPPETVALRHHGSD